MSGLVVGVGEVSAGEVEAMLAKLAHRGGFLSGTHVEGETAMGQNYLRADNSLAAPGSVVPYGEAGSSLRICYDGQIGNRGELASRLGLEDGAFLEERILLRLYAEKGARMLEDLGDAIFAFAIAGGGELFAARDLMGIKTLFYGHRGEDLFLASELKALTGVTEEIREFPPGHMMDAGANLVRFAELPVVEPALLETPLEQIEAEIRDIVERSARSRIDFAVTTGSLLSGGLDSSIISYLASQMYLERFGPAARLPTFALGVGVSEDIVSARLVAEHIGSEHHELIVGVEDLVAVLPEVIYHLESFDPSLVRSSVANYLMSRYAAEHGIEVLLSGEGGDEMFCGYAYMAELPPEELFEEQIACFGYLHSNASLRLDRMNQCNSIKVVAPFVSGELFEYVIRIPGEYKLHPEGDRKIEKWVLRRAFAPFLPPEITARTKQEFSQGTGVADLLPARIEPLVADEELARVQAEFPFVRTKEECYYFRLFGEHFGYGRVVETVGQWVNL